MRSLALIAAAIAALTLSACVGLIVPIPASSGSSVPEPDRSGRR